MLRRVPKWTLAILLAAPVGWFAMQLPGRSLELRARPVAPGELRISWDRGSVPALTAAAAVLQIDDGGDVFRRRLSAALLRDSSFTYAVRSGDVLVRLRVVSKGGEAIEQTVRYHGAPAAVEVAHAAIAPPPILRRPARRSTVKTAENIPPFDAADRAVVEPVTPPAPALRPFTIAQQPAAQAASPLLAAPPVSAGMPQMASAHLLNLPVPKPQFYEGPRAGRLIWTGSLGRRGVVEIEGGRASLGELSGYLPGMPVSFHAEPAEFSSDGLVVFTADRRMSGRVERAGPSNGWNATHFEFDPARAQELVVLETPNPSNDFKRLALRSDARKCSVIVVDWNVP